MQPTIKYWGAVLSLLATAVRGQWASPEASTDGTVLSGIRDPSLIRRQSDGKYFLFGTNGNCTLHTATSINGPWTRQVGGALNINQTCVAPQVYQVDDTYYMYYSQHTGPTTDWYYTANIHVASSPTMEQGSWTTHGEMSIPLNNAKLANHASTDGYNVLDASLLVANSSAGAQEYYLSFGSYYSGLYQTPLSSPTDLSSDVSVEGMNRLEWNSTGGHSTEGSFQFAWPVDGATKYFLFFSSGQCCKFNQNGVPAVGDAYKIMVCRSDAPTGPFVDDQGKDCVTENGGTMVLASHDAVYAPGGQGVMYSDEVDSVVMYYHYSPVNTTAKTLLPDLSVNDNGAKFGWNKLQFNENGWPEIQGSATASKGSTASEGSSASSPSASMSKGSLAQGQASDSGAQTSAAQRRISYPWRGWF